MSPGPGGLPRLTFLSLNSSAHKPCSTAKGSHCSLRLALGLAGSLLHGGGPHPAASISGRFLVSEELSPSGVPLGSIWRGGLSIVVLTLCHPGLSSLRPPGAHARLVSPPPHSGSRCFLELLPQSRSWVLSQVPSHCHRVRRSHCAGHVPGSHLAGSPRGGGCVPLRHRLPQ